MGPQHLKMALNLLHSGDFQGWLTIIMDYYDRLYGYGNDQRDSKTIFPIESNLENIDLLAQSIIDKKNIILKNFNG